jgi:Leucine-rich repeat (LRR) protein
MLSGVIPSSVEQASKLEVLQLDMNSLQGSLPMGLFMLTNLQDLNLEQNRKIAGRLDAALGNWARMEALSISHTNVQSRIPAEVRFLTNLRVLRMASTQLSGIIPSEIALLTKLNHLDLSGSKFRRSIPKGLGNLPSLGKCTHGF